MKNKFWYFYTTFRSISTLFLSRKLLIVRIFIQISFTRTFKMKYMTLNLGHTLKYDSKTQSKFFCIFCTTSTKIPIFTSLSAPSNNRIWSTKNFSTHTIWKYTLLCPRKWKKIQINFLDSLAGFLALSHICVSRLTT